MNTPRLLILFRFILVPIILGLAYIYKEDARPIILILMYLGLLSDIFDGIIARQQNISTTTLRRMDSQVDMLFWLSIGIASWMIHPQLISANATGIWIIITLEMISYATSLLKFKRENCTHAFLSKLWGISLLVAFTALIGFNHTGIPFIVMLFMGVLSNLDVILITLILPQWTHDVPSSYHAYLIRKGIDFKRNVYLNG